MKQMIFIFDWWIRYTVVFAMVTKSFFFWDVLVTSDFTFQFVGAASEPGSCSSVIKCPSMIEIFFPTEVTFDRIVEGQFA